MTLGLFSSNESHIWHLWYERLKHLSGWKPRLSALSQSVSWQIVTDNTPVWTGNGLEPKCNWKMNEWYGLLTHWNVLGSFEFHIKSALGSLHVGSAEMRRELHLIVEKSHNDITEKWSLLRFTFLLPRWCCGKDNQKIFMLCCLGDESRFTFCPLGWFLISTVRDYFLLWHHWWQYFLANSVWSHYILSQLLFS